MPEAKIRDMRFQINSELDKVYEIYFRINETMRRTI